LDIDVSRNLLQSAEDFKPVWMHRRVSGSEGVVGIDLLEPRERLLQDGERTLNDGATLETVDIP